MFNFEFIVMRELDYKEYKGFKFDLRFLRILKLLHIYIFGGIRLSNFCNLSNISFHANVPFLYKNIKPCTWSMTSKLS